MFYFGPWDCAGHSFFGEGGTRPLQYEAEHMPWGKRWLWKIDGGLIPNKDYSDEGKAHVTHGNGWTALSFWDMSVDTRPASHSTYIAEGDFTFEQMVEMASRRFAVRWNRMKFQVVPV
jgi:hypothetical protein